MSRKAIVVVALAATIAASTGVAFASNNTNTAHVRGADGDPVSSIVQQVEVSGDNDNQKNAEADIVQANGGNDTEQIDNNTSNQLIDDDAGNNTETTQTINQIESVQSGENSNSENGAFSYVRLPVKTYSIQRIIDINNGEEILPQLVFGKYYNECYLTLFNNGTADICLNPAAGDFETGSYTVEGDYMIVNYGNDREASYKLVYSEKGDIESIIVSSGANVIYFG